MTTTLYRFFDKDDRLLYVGIAGNPGRRFHQHATTKPWWQDVARATMEHHAARADAELAERTAILAEEPMHNIAHRHGAVRCKPTPKPPTSGQLADGSSWWVDIDGPCAFLTVDRLHSAAAEDVEWSHLAAERGIGAVRALGYKGDIVYGGGEDVWAIPCATHLLGELLTEVERHTAAPAHVLAAFEHDETGR